MLVDNDILRARYVANGTTTDFAIPFPFLDETHIVVYTRLDEKDEPISPASYIVHGAGDQGGGTLEFRVAPTAGSVIVILRNVPITQMYDYTELDNFPAESHENALAKRTMVEQQLAEGLERAIKLDITDPRTAEQFQKDLFAAMEQARKDAEHTSKYVQDIPVIKSSLEEVAAEDRDGLFWVPGITRLQDEEETVYVKTISSVLGSGAGYCSLSNGLQVCWGHEITSNGDAVFEFPKAFVSAPTLIATVTGSVGMYATANSVSNVGGTLSIFSGTTKYTAAAKVINYIAIGAGA